MAQPTTGEWRVVGISQIYAGEKMIALTAIKDVDAKAERIANLELMAAAPALLAELQNLVTCWDNDTFQDVDIEYARKAIAKARKSQLQQENQTINQ